jgi:hypothetical protein
VSTEHFDVIVVGGGPNGRTCAAYVAKASRAGERLLGKTRRVAACKLLDSKPAGDMVILNLPARSRSSVGPTIWS